MNSNRIYGLDLLRAIAILLVIYGHSITYVNANLPKTGDGVAIFFVLSGFLIGKILFKSLTEDFGLKQLTQFWKRRWLRTLPLYLFMLTLVSIVKGHFFWTYYVFCQNLGKGDVLHMPETWSLAIEEWFYLLVPIFFLLFLKHFDKKRLPVLIISIITILTVSRFLATDATMNEDIWDNYLRRSVAFNSDSIMYGVLAAYISFYKKEVWNKLKKLFPFGVVLWVAIIAYKDIASNINPFLLTLILSLQYIATFCLLPYLSGVKQGKGVVFRFMTFVSIISYSLYLINWTPVHLILNIDRIQLLTAKYHWLPLVIYITASFGGAYFLNKFIEKPFMNLRDKHVKPHNTNSSRLGYALQFYKREEAN